VLEPFCERYLTTLVGSKLKASLQSLPKFNQFCQTAGLHLDEVSAEHLEEFRQSLLWTPGSHGRFYSAHTVSQVLTRTRQFLRWALEEGLLVADPSLNLRVGAVVKIQGRLLKPSEIRAVLDGPERTRPIGLRDALFLALVTTTGLKIRQCLRLRPADLERLPLEASLAELAKRYLREGRPLLARAGQETSLLLNREGSPLSLFSANPLAKMWGERVGLGAGITARLLRRSWLAEAESFARSRVPFPLTDENP
jgi:site-specific recombinase XerD